MPNPYFEGEGVDIICRGFLSSDKLPTKADKPLPADFISYFSFS